MRCTVLVLLVLAIGCARQSDTSSAPAPSALETTSPFNAPEEPPDERLHSEHGVVTTIAIDRRGQFHRLMVGEFLWGTQYNEWFERHWLDDFGWVVPGCPWDMIAVFGANASFNRRLDPLCYYHRAGPVGAMFRELRTRKKAEDATAPVAVLGLAAGTEAAYALRGQSLTFYEADPALKRLVADTDKYFTYIADAQKRGATINIRIGTRRDKLAEDKDREYALILVDQGESFPISRDVFTKEAVQLYFDRMTDDGILGLHISNRYINLEPMIERMARELNLEARVWYDNAPRGAGNTASAWIVLAKSVKALGTLALPVDLQRRRFGTEFRPLEPQPGVQVWTDKRQDFWSLAFEQNAEELRRLLDRKR